MPRSLIPFVVLPAVLALCCFCTRIPGGNGPDSGDSLPGDSDDSQPGDSDDSSTGDSGDSLPGDSGDSGEPDPTTAHGSYSDGSRWWVVTLDVEQRSIAAVVAPPEGEGGRYAAGAPVVMAVGHGIVAPVACSDAPLRYLRVHGGVVVVQFLTPGQCCMGVCSGTADNVGGSVSRQAVDDLRDFALNRTRTVGGDTLSSLVEQPLLEDELVVILGSSRATSAMEAMAADPDGYATVRAVLQYEVAYYPALTGLELGVLMQDPDLTVDADGDGFLADDGRYPHYQIGDCADGRCRLDRAPLAWDPNVAIRDVYHEASAEIIPQRDRRGVLYADGNGNGRLDLRSTHVDLDGDGLVEPDEDFVFFGLIQDTGLTDELYWHSPELLQDALNLGVLSADAWPEHFPTLAEVEAFWGERDHPAAMQRVAAALPDVYWSVLGCHEDHGQGQPTRPHTVLMYNDLLQAGVQPQLNFSNAALEEANGPVSVPYEPLYQGAPLSEQNVSQFVAPAGVGEAGVRAAGVLHACDMLWGD